MASINIQKVTKSPVYLSKPEDWTMWLFQYEDLATASDVWVHCDPSKPWVELGPAPTRPIRPSGNISAETLKLYSFDRSDWEHDYKVWKRKEETLKAILTDIPATINKHHIPLIKSKHTVWGRLKTLHDHIAPSDPSRKSDLRRQWEDVRNTRRARNQNLESWLDDWLRITDLMTSLNMPEMTEGQPNEHFLNAVMSINESWATQKLVQLLADQQDSGRAENLPSISSLIAEFRQFQRITGRRILNATFSATLGITNGHNAGKNTDKCPGKNCYCGLPHWYNQCAYLIAHLRPADWKEDKAITAKFAAASQNPVIKAKFDKAILSAEKQRQKQAASNSKSTECTHSSNSSAIPFDDGTTIPRHAGSNSVWSASSNPNLSRTYACWKPHATFSASNDNPPAFIDRWIMDPGSNTHVTNSKQWDFVHTRFASNSDVIYAGSQLTPVMEYGTVEIPINSPEGVIKILLTEVAYVPTFFSNILGLSRCRSLGLHFDSGSDMIYQAPLRKPVALLEYIDGHWLIDAHEGYKPDVKQFTNMAAQRSSRPSKDPKPALEVTPLEAHHIYAHPGPSTIAHLESAVNGLRIKDGSHAPKWTECEDCIKTKMNELVSRRPPEVKATKPFERIAIDIIHLLPTGKQCYNRDKYLLHAICQHCKWHEGETMEHKDKHWVVPAVYRIIEKVQRQFGFKYVVIVLRSDDDRAYTNEMQCALRSVGMKVELTAPYTQQPKGLQEAAGKTIMARTRAICISANIPSTLVNEVAMTALQLLNTTPIEKLGWRTPYEIVHGRKPTVSHYQPIGCRAYALKKGTYALKTADKTSSRVHIGYLMGYDSTNIFRIWIPAISRLIRTRDVIFNPKVTWSDDRKEGLHAPPISEVDIEILDLTQPVYEVSAEDLFSTEQNERHIEEVTSSTTLTSITTPTEQHSKAPDDQGQLLTPAASRFGSNSPPLPLSPLAAETTLPETPHGPDVQSQPLEQEAQQHIHHHHQNNEASTSRRETNRRHNTAPRSAEISGNNTEDFILSTRTRSGRTTQPLQTQDAGQLRPRGRGRGRPPLGTHFAYLSTFATLHQVKAAAIPTAPSTLPTKIHSSQLPPLPKRVKDLEKHPFGSQFRQCMTIEIENCVTMNCFERTDATIYTALAEVLPLMWVFTYKFDQNGYLSKTKARIVVRGDLQTQWGDTYAATLAARVFRALIAIATRFGLLMFQYDATNAFLNARIDRLVYVHTPEGFTDQLGKLLILKRALYGLKDAPTLWYKELTKSLAAIGLHQVPNTPCLFINDDLIVFFYVDDIAVLVHPSKLAAHKLFECELMKRYSIRAMGQLQWFLGIRLLRTEDLLTTWLVQDAFIEQAVKKYGLIDGATALPDCPISNDNLIPYTGPTDEKLKATYQELIGSLRYISAQTRPDVAKACSYLAQFNMNPGPQHLGQAVQTWKFLWNTRTTAMKASASAVKQEGHSWAAQPSEVEESEPIFFGASVASFADDTDTRASSEGYLFKLFRLPIDWKATKQRTVTKSTTEAELYALSRTGSEIIWWTNLFTELKFNPDIEPVVYCDNAQTVGVVTKPNERLQTKLRHVDIHQMWIRQAVQRGEINVHWIPTKQMPADGFTKVLTGQKHAVFRSQLGLEDITQRLKTVQQI